ncbi:hypothetical protein F3Y22_tig00002840pilonHSYRG00591 [Hibiscus syriacus]|uniref:Uncharacterized protein n=1 Tax=Hibiscus syriacus TaxID=106335 RepID=A0A6A3CV99_HIBSY|nr:hypothetical protein F3Y22_tig00002840pilonHSYRG00591 [Hibiscus syriacus]
MAGFGVSATHHHIMVAMFVVVVCYVSRIMAQDIAPSPAMDTGSGLTFPASGVLLCSSMLVSLFAVLLLQ